MTRRFIYYCATSADGFIARSDGSVDWLESRPSADYGFAEFMERIDTIVWGRTTFDGFGAAPSGLEPFGDKARHIVLTHRPLPPGTKAETASDARDLADRLRGEPGKDVWLMGGGRSAEAFLDAGALDEVFIHVIPVLLGDGVPLFPRRAREVALTLVESHAFPDGVVRLRYRRA